MKINNPNIAKKTVNIILDILIGILGLILLITIYNNIQIKILGNDYSSFFGRTIFEVQTGSMSDAINAGDWIIVKEDSNIKLNDIVTFEHKGEYITHRVIESYNGTFVTKGDANTAKDSPISKDQIVGKVVKVLPHFGILRKTIFNPIVLIALIITCYLIGTVFKKQTEEELAKEKKMVEKIKKTLKPKKNNVNKKKEQPKKEENKKQTREVKVEKEKEEKKKQKVTKKEKQVDVEEIKQDNEVIEENEEVTNNPVVEESVSENLVEDSVDMDKTVFFRMLSVDESEISNAYNPKALIEEEENLVAKVVKEEPEVSEAEIKSMLELIQKKKKRCKNFVEKAMFIKKEELSELFLIINRSDKLKTNEPTIKDKFIDSYVDAKYYNNCGDINLEYNGRNMNARIEKAMNEVATKLKKSYKGSDTKYAEKVDRFEKFIILINYLEQDYKSIDDLQLKKDTYNKRILKYIKFNDLSAQDLKAMIIKILKIQRKYNGMLKFLLNKLSTGMFELNYNSISKKNTYAVELQHNIQFSKVYSEYIVDKTYTEGVVAEDKIEVLASLLISQLVKNMLNSNFNTKYVIYIPGTLYEKSNKLDKIFKMFDDEFAKNSISILLQFEELSNNKKVIKALKKEGYNFSVDMNNVERMKKSDEALLHIMDNIFISKSKSAKTNILELIPEDLKSNVLHDDISSKVGNF